MAIEGENKFFSLVRCTTDDEWLEQRKHGVGGSEVAAIMGLSPWKTATQLWLEKTGRIEPADLSEKPYVAFGTIMEPVIGDWYREKFPDRTVRRVNAICKSLIRPWAQASLDYEVRDGSVWGVLEIKTARTAADWQDGVPAYYLTQIMHYMQVTNRPFADVAVFFRDTCEFKCFRVDYDKEDGDAVKAAVDDFWRNYVMTGTMPQVVGTSGEAAALTDYYGKGDGDFKQLIDPDVDAAVSAYQDAAEREKQAHADKTEAATKLIAAIGDAKGIITDVAKVTWVRSEREVLDQKALKEQAPEVYAKYSKTESRNGGLRIKEL